jgi:hypothetical protein
MKLTDSQLIVLSTASQREDLSVLPLPGTMKGAAADKITKSLLAKKLIAEKPGAAAGREWRTGRDGTRLGLVITPAGLKAVGLEPAVEKPEVPANVGPSADHGGKTAKPHARRKDRRKARPAPARDSRRPSADARAPREGSKLAKLVAMLRRPEGATIDRLAKAMGWQHHTVRGAIAGALKKKLGLKVTSEKSDSGTRLYRIAG